MYEEESIHGVGLVRAITTHSLAPSPRQPGDEWKEATIQAAEERLGLRLPNPLRNFYLAWGQRRDMTQLQDSLLDPDELIVRASALIFCVENQAVGYWGVLCKTLQEDAPPVVTIWSGRSGWEVESEPNWTPGHAHLSLFLDDFTTTTLLSPEAPFREI